MPRLPALVVAAAAVITLAGCSGPVVTSTAPPSDSATPQAAPTTRPAPVAASSAPITTSYHPPTSDLVLPDAPVAIGEPVSVDLTPWGSGAFRATVHEVKVAPRSEYSMVPEGQQTVGVDVEVCVTAPQAGGAGSTVQADERWALGDAKNGRYEPASSSMSDDDTLTPAYPYYAQPVAVGECVRGWIPFVTAAGAPVNTVRYAVGGTSNTIRWTVPAT